MSQINLADLQAAFEESKTKTAEPKPDGTLRDVTILVKDITGETKTAQKSGNEYIQIILEYRNLDFDRLEEKKVAMFDTEQAEVVLGLEVKKTYKVSQIKRNGYWVWTGAEAVEDK